MNWYYAWINNRLVARSNYTVAVRRIIFNRLAGKNATAKITTDLEGKHIFEVQRPTVQGWPVARKYGKRDWNEISELGEIVGIYKLNKPKKVIVEWYDKR